RRAVRADRIEGLGGQRTTGPRERPRAHGHALPFHRDTRRVERPPGGLDHLGTDPVAGDQGDADRQLRPPDRGRPTPRFCSATEPPTILSEARSYHAGPRRAFGAPRTKEVATVSEKGLREVVAADTKV